MNLTRSFADFEPYRDAIVHADVRMRVLGMEQPRYSIVQSVAGGLGLQWAQEGSGQLSEGSTDRGAFGLYMQLNARPRLLNGMPLDPHSIVVLPPGAEFCFSCDHANSWLAVRVPIESVAVPGETAQEDLLDSVSVVRAGRNMARTLRTSVLTYLRSLENESGLSLAPAAETSFESEMLLIARRICARSSDMKLDSEHDLSPRSKRHDRIAMEAAELIEASWNGSISVATVAKSLGVSERTLLTAFRSRHDKSPRQFIQAMRLNRARTRLRLASESGALIQDVAAECGFWDFGRFASKYQRLFGELPTQTVKKGRSIE